jgi:hypothetical protein
MIRRLLHRSSPAFLALAGIAMAPALAVAAESNNNAATDPNRPRTLYRQAEAAFTAGRFDEARKLLLEAWGIRRTYDVAAALGQAELELKMYRDAAEHLDFAVQNFAPMESEGVLNGTKNDLRAAKSEVVEARITVNEPHATVTANGRVLGESPLAASVFLDPGSYDFEATVGQGRKVTKRVVLQKGGTYDVALVIPQIVAPATGLEAAAPPASDATSDRGTWIPTYVAGGLAVVALGVGTGFAVDALSAKSSGEDRLNAARAMYGSEDACAAGNGAGSALCNDVKDSQDRRHSSNTAATASFVVGGVLAAASIGSYFLWARKPERGRPQVTASIGSGGGGVFVQGSF